MLQDQLQVYKGNVHKGGYRGPTTYMGKEVAPWNHPTSIANIVLNTVKHTFMFGIQILAPPGHGKSTLASVVAHHIHEESPDYDVIWAGAYEFTHQEEFFKGLSKKPHVIIFDDITGALKQMSGKEIEANFEALTKVRWYLDPATGKIPVVIITTSHYSKNLEKQIRTQLGMTIFCGFGIEEQSNIDTFTKKGSRAFSTLESYGRISDSMFKDHEFALPLPSGKKIPYKTDDPFRCACRLSYSDAQMVLFSDKDMCEKCSKQQYKKYVDPHVLFEKIRTFFPTERTNRPWVEAISHFLVKHNVSKILNPKAASILDWLEQDFITTYATNLEELNNIFWAEYKKKSVPKKVYHRRKRASEIGTELEKASVRVAIEETKLETSEIDPKDPFNENELDKEFEEIEEDFG